MKTFLFSGVGGANKLFCKKPIALMVAATVTATTVNAQTDKVVDGPTLEEVVVTAQRREQNLQEVPVSVTAFTGEKLTQSGIGGAAEYLALTPNVGFSEDGQTGSRGVAIAIRGVGNVVTGETAYINSVGIYLDEFSVASVPNQVANPQLPDIERIEVLRGPQGTYFGRNSLGGALNITTKKPTDEFEGRITLGYEDIDDAGDTYNITGVVNVPVSDTFRMRAVVNHEDSDGIVENVNPTGNDSDHEYTAFRLNTVWEATDRTTVSTTLFYTEEEQGTDATIPTGALDIDTIATISFGGWNVVPSTGLYPQTRNKVNRNTDESNEQESLVAILNVAHELNDTTTIKWVSGFIDAELTRVFDQDQSSANLFERNNSYEGFSWSTELRVEIAEDAFDFVAGVLYAKDDQDQDNLIFTPDPGATFNGTGFLPPFPADLALSRNSRNFEVESLALFADYTWHVNDKWDVIFGGRYTRDTISNDFQGYGLAPSCAFVPVPPPTCAGGGPGADPFFFFQSFVSLPRNPAVESEEDFNDFAPRFVARYNVSDDTNVYASISKGYKAGGTSVGNDTNNNNAPISIKYDKETLWNYELGLKTEFWNNRVRLNAAIFQLKWEDLQLEAFRFLTVGDLSSNFEQTINVDEAKATGAEVEFIAALTEGFTLTGGFGYLDSEIEKSDTAQITGGFVVNLEGLDVPKAPEFTANLSGEQRWQIDGGEAWARLEYVYRDGQFSDVEALTYKQTRGQPIPDLPTATVPAVGSNGFPFSTGDYELFNLYAGVDLETVSFTVYVKNLMDEEYITGTGENFGLSGIRVKPHPRIIGASFTYNF